MDTAVYWIEYVIRNGPNVMRSSSLNLTWWQLALLDVYAFILLVFLLSNIALFYVFRICLNILRGITSSDIPLERKLK